MAGLHNTGFGRDPDAPPARPADFDPWETYDERRRGRLRVQANQNDHVPIEALKWLWIDGQQR